MDYLQYFKLSGAMVGVQLCFKPYYKWITFNTGDKETSKKIIHRFKPYYKWITFNTKYRGHSCKSIRGFKPYYKWITFNTINYEKHRKDF